jgi:outer membrane protein assembly factor BamB
MLRSPEPPPLPDLLGTLIAMAEGHRRKALLPLPGQPAEYAILRRGSNVLVSYYHTEASPEVVVLDRRVPLRAAIDGAAAALSEELEQARDPRAREFARRLVARAAEVPIVSDDDGGASAIRRLGGVLENPGPREALAFGFEAAIFPSADSSPAAGQNVIAHADIHAMLFQGSLWAWVRGRRIPLAKGPILLPVQRMVSAVRALVEAADAARPVHLRLRSGAFVVAVRRSKTGEVALTLGNDEDGTVTIPALDLESASLPILRVASDLLRTLVAVDRTQTRNLRIRALRDEVRHLRRIVRTQKQTESFVNVDSDRLRASAPPREPRMSADPLTPSAWHFVRRWSAAVDGLDAESTFLCGKRLVVATPRQVIALDRDTGEPIWRSEGGSSVAFLAGTELVRVAADGLVEVREVADGELLLQTRIAPRIGPPFGMSIGGGSVPPAAVVAEGRDRLVAIDLRTGEMRWRFWGRGAVDLRVERSGRLLLVVRGDGSVHAIDAATGEIAWRHTSSGRYCLTPLAYGDTVVVVSGEPGRGEAELVTLDLYSGRERCRRRLGGAARSAPIAAGDLALIAISSGQRTMLVAIDAQAGELRWRKPDPALGIGGAALALDHALVINTPRGSVHALDLGSGESIWSRNLAHPMGDEVPRRLDPVLRGGALFVPSAAVHVLRPTDGRSIGGPLPCDLVPDVMRVDERGWAYVGEESGHLVALAPERHLTLVRP